MVTLFIFSKSPLDDPAVLSVLEAALGKLTDVTETIDPLLKMVLLEGYETETGLARDGLTGQDVRHILRLQRIPPELKRAFSSVQDRDEALTVVEMRIQDALKGTRARLISSRHGLHSEEMFSVGIKGFASSAPV